MHVVLLSGSPSARSRTELLLEYASQRLQGHGLEVSLLRVRDFPAEALLYADFASAAVQQLQAVVASADGLVVATPVYKASFTGALKVLLDLLPERALAHKAVLPLASGGSPAHLLAVDYALKPVLAALKAQEMLPGVFAVDKQIAYPEGGAPARIDDELRERLDESLDQLLAALARRPKPIDPSLLNDRLASARWGI
ncbi:NADPH-dependent FMN reductase [Metapseudomonas furukawaii]|jgi:FMN reductase|uniref:FMN reductase n=1 Tax=Metapseudomonas furukawaii TaxID=1149133 RepID=A0AAD1C3P4_METFU|nr:MULTISPECIES: NADPH-dependent FMN reductase [Pseudomonas]ELS24118.1 FMN reductase [Pseudomonas furukawaii]OWJ97684.1 FMN reductase (NADPH) [Pseudomonas sp. A46]BAU74964.1 FMN reductase [Pseudomonas furukawaii]